MTGWAFVPALNFKMKVGLNDPIALRLARQCHDNGLVKYWFKKEIVQETWICELPPLNN